MVPARQHYDGHFTTPSLQRRIDSAAIQRTNEFPVFGRSAEAFVAHDYGQPLVVVDAAGMEVCGRLLAASALRRGGGVH